MDVREVIPCDLCGDAMVEDAEVKAATGLNICPICLEASIDAATFNPSSTLELVGGVRPW